MTLFRAFRRFLNLDAVAWNEVMVGADPTTLASFG